MQDFRPMLAAKGVPPDSLRYPVLASPKIDGVRCTIVDGVALSRTLKLIPNAHVLASLSLEGINGYDGELVVGSPTSPDCYRNTTSGVMTHSGKPDFTFYVFDNYLAGRAFSTRLSSIKERRFIKKVQHKTIRDAFELSAYEQECLALGYEGIMVRDPGGAYKFGRSTEREGGLIKMKRFDDSEAEIVDVIELMHNENEAKRNALGKLERSSCKENKVPAGCMGALSVFDVHTGVKFEIGTGFTEHDRKLFWVDRHKVIGLTVKYKFFAGGVKDKPRFPVFLGMRPKIDIQKG